MRNNIEERRELFKDIRRLRDDHDLIPFVTMKYLSEKQENSKEDIREFNLEYGFTFRDYELLSHIIEKQENDDESYVSDFKSSINALKNANNSYIKEIYSNIPNKSLKNEVIEQLLKVLKNPIGVKRLFFEINLRSFPFIRGSLDGRLPGVYNKILCELLEDNHNVVRVYDPTCRDANIITKLKNFQSATLFEKDEKTYFHAIQNLIIHDIPLDKINISNEEIIIDESDTKYDTIISTPYEFKGQSKLVNSYDDIEKYNDLKTKNPNSLHLINLIEHLSDDGILITVTSLDLLVKKDAYNLRKCLIDNNILDSIIEYDKSYRNDSNIILIIKRNKKSEDILFMKKNNEDMHSIINPRRLLDCYRERTKIQRFSDIISNKEIIENEYNLNPRRYVYSLNYVSKDLNEIKEKQKAYASKIRSLDEEIDNILDKISKL